MLGILVIIWWLLLLLMLLPAPPSVDAVHERSHLPPRDVSDEMDVRWLLLSELSTLRLFTSLAKSWNNILCVSLEMAREWEALCLIKN